MKMRLSKRIGHAIKKSLIEGLPGWIPATAMTGSILAITWMSVMGDANARETLKVFGGSLATWGGAMVTAWLGYRGWKVWKENGKAAKNDPERNEDYD